MKNKENGITLIALIITIIVMLILVGVTINVAISGGLFDKAKIATEQTQKQVSKEQLISTMVGAYDSAGKFIKPAQSELPKGAKWCKEDENYETASGGDWIVTENGNKFYIDENGTVLEEKPQQQTNPWIRWGLSSGDVVYNTPSSNIAYEYTSGDANGLTDSNGVILTFYSDGRFYTGWDGKSYTAEQTEGMLNYCILRDNFYIVPSQGWGFVFKPNKIMELYIDESITSEESLNSILNLDAEARATYLESTFTATLQD